jgi:hypothetical protein
MGVLILGQHFGQYTAGVSTVTIGGVQATIVPGTWVETANGAQVIIQVPGGTAGGVIALNSATNGRVVSNINFTVNNAFGCP